ncbi:hypothetical protein GCM10010129_68720 [Streptomyces fumigatiscleroticus]|nr:hypothetical protein GCM10010129_68720 [Streptomyces fumigatiscleroticus]
MPVLGEPSGGDRDGFGAAETEHQLVLRVWLGDAGWVTMLQELHVHRGARQPKDNAVVSVMATPLGEYRQAEDITVEDQNIVVMRGRPGEADRAYVEVTGP